MKNNMINGVYKIVDCEHKGDIDYAKKYLLHLGCGVNDIFWDGRDCGAATIDFTISSKLFPKVYPILCNNTTFDVDINDYIVVDFMSDYLIPYKDLINKLNYYKTYVGTNFEKNIPVLLFFNLENTSLSPNYVVNTIMNMIGKGTKIVNVSSQINQGDTYYHVLFLTDYHNICNKNLKKIGDYSLSLRNGWLKNNNIYGECSCRHELYINQSCWEDKDISFLNTIERIKKHKDLIYCNKWGFKKVLKFDEAVKNNKLLVSVNDYILKSDLTV